MGYSSLNAYLRTAFGGKVYKIALSGDFTCPTRDGTKGFGGCIFCQGGSGSFAQEKNLPVSVQLQQGKRLVAAKLKNVEAPKYIAYFQSYSGTYAPVSYLKGLFEAAMADPEVVALSVGTRPDCLDGEVLALLAELNRKKPVWVELGLQTSNEKTAAWFHRGYDNAVFTDAVRALKERGITVIAHLILGFPGEGHADEIESVRFACRAGIDGIKLHLLHILKGTVLAEMDIAPLSREEYVWRVCDLLQYIPPRVVIHRLTGDGDKRLLLAPLWSADKKAVWNAIQKEIASRGIEQGALADGAEQ